MNEIYGDHVQYIEPRDYNRIVLPEKCEHIDTSKLLNKYSWKESVQVLLSLIKRESGK